MTKLMTKKTANIKTLSYLISQKAFFKLCYEIVGERICKSQQDEIKCIFSLVGIVLSNV